MELINCQLKVSESGRERVLRTHRKNVHAYVIGDLVQSYDKGFEPTPGQLSNMPYDISYNPYTCTNFMGFIGKDSYDLKSCHRIIMWINEFDRPVVRGG